jgi:hypothetical protein
MDVWGLHAMRCHIDLKLRHDALNRAQSTVWCGWSTEVHRAGWGRLPGCRMHMSIQIIA